MDIDNSRIYKFISTGMVATLFVVVASFLALYLSSLDDQISARGYGVFAIQTALTASGFSTMLASLNGAGLVLMKKYLMIDIVFTFSCAWCFPAVIALIFAQYKDIMKKIGNLEIDPAYVKARNIIIFFAPISFIFGSVCNGITFYMMKTHDASTLLTAISGTSQYIRVLLLLISLGFTIYILIKRRKYIKQLYTQG